MRDYYKGGILLLLATLASVFTLSIDDHGFDIAVIKFESEDSDVAALQQQILAGFDPSETQQPTAAGPVAVPTCFRGALSRDSQSDSYHGSRFVSIKDNENMYLLLPDDQVYLRRETFQTQTADMVSALPEHVAVKLGKMQNSAECARVDVYLHGINY
ncbi:MAG: hypothetical protein ACPG4U_14880 [Pseudomonadales bacterium]